MPLSDQFLSSTGIRNITRKILVDNVFSPMKIDNQWKVLVVDEFGMKVMSACFKTEEVMSFKIALIEKLENFREPLPYFSAIYFLCPSVQNVGHLTADFTANPLKYLCVHLFFLARVSDELFEDLLRFAEPGIVLTFKEIDLQFLAHESQVFSLNESMFFSMYYDAYKELDLDYCSLIATKLNSFCTSLNMCPRIRYRRHFVKNLILAESLQREFDSQPETLPFSRLEKQRLKPRCEILILDRGFDCITPLMHEFTLQAMAYDLLEIDDDIYVYRVDDEKQTISEISVTEADPLWCKLRHEHIAQVTKIIDRMTETNRLLRNHAKLARYKNLPQLGETVKKHLADKNLRPQLVFKHMANECMQLYCKGVNTLAEAEQRLAFGLLWENEIDARSIILNILCSEFHNMTDKLRLFLLYIFYRKGISKKEFEEIVTQSKLPLAEARYITNFLHLDIDLFRPGFCRSFDLEREEADSSPSGSTQSRWIPVLKSIIINCIEGSLSLDKYPYLNARNRKSVISDVRTGYWCKDKKGEYMCRLIIFIAGGVTHSEMRTVYEVMAQYKGWEIYIGGDTLLTPQKLFNKLKELRCFISKDE